MTHRPVVLSAKRESKQLGPHSLVSGIAKYIGYKVQRWTHLLLIGSATRVPVQFYETTQNLVTLVVLALLTAYLSSGHLITQVLVS